VKEIGLNSTAYGTHTLRRTEASLIYRRTKNLRAMQLMLGHSETDSRAIGGERTRATEGSEKCPD
jgi:site-specific recombinase XerD